jgi:hypothetical protein
MNPTITISPNGGFGNRIRVMCAAYFYADKNDCSLNHLWDGGKYTCAYPHIQLVHDRGFAYFFKEKGEFSEKGDSTDNMICYSEWVPSATGWWRHQNYGQQKLKCTTILGCDSIPSKPDTSFLIETTHRFIPMTSLESYAIYKKYFIPQDKFIKQLNVLPQNTIGISIRRSEFLYFFPEANVGEDVLHKWLKSFRQPIVLFSEDKEFLNNARKIMNTIFLCDFEMYPQEKEDRAFLEFLTLSSCSHVYGTTKSSFAEEAALFGNVPYTAITKELIVLE